MTETVVPTPGRLFNFISPPCSKTMCFTIDKPRPVPPVFRDLDESTTKNLSNSLSVSMTERLIPIPVSIQLIITEL